MAAEPPDSDAAIRIDDASLGATFAAGQRVFVHYVLETEIGRGGMGVVWRAKDERLGESVALKFLPATVARDAVSVDELKEETRRARRLRHPNIVNVYGFEQDATMVAIAMEAIEGTTLAQLRLQQPGKVYAAETLAPLVKQICAALTYAHTEAKVAHRDLKPANVLVTREGTAKLADFGIARSLTETHTRLTGQTRGGTSGTLPYMSPQQLHGRNPTAADDLYALGAMLYELLVSKPPFHRGEMATLMLQIREDPPLPLSEKRAELEISGAPIPPSWEETIIACLAKRVEDRPASAASVLAMLEGRAVSGDRTLRIPDPAPVSERSAVNLTTSEKRANPDDRGQVDRATKSRRPLWLGLAGAAVLAALAAVFWPKQETKPNPVGPALVAVPPTSISPPAPIVLAREFTVTVDPADAGAHLWLGPQSDVAVPADGRAIVKDLSDGEHELIVQAPGYQPLTTRVTVKDGRGTAEAKLVAVKGAVEITARAGTIVTAVDARGRETRLGSLPATGKLSSDNVLTIGTYVFKFNHADCAEVRQENVELAIGRPVKLDPTQTPLPGELRVFSVPTAAEVSVNGKKVGATPATIPAQPSETPLSIEVYVRGYRRSTQSVTLKPKETRTVNVGTLTSESGGIELRIADSGLRIDPKLTIQIDGKLIEVGRVVPNAPFRFEGLELGALTVALSHPDYEPWRQSVTVRDQQTTAVDVKLVPKPGRLAIRAEPREIVLTLNGRAVRANELKNGELTVPAGEAVALAASAPGYKPATRTFTLAANGRESWEVALEKQSYPEPGQAWENTLGMEFVPVPGTPVLFGVWDVRVQDYEKFVSATKRDWPKPSFKQGPTHPAVNVSWDDAQAFCAWLTKQEQAAGRLGPNQKYRLPTDAEWSVAVGLNESRSGTPQSKNMQIKNVYPWGTQFPPPRGAGNYGSSLEVDDFENTSPVGSFAANKFGLYDMGGNVWQWCEDLYDGNSGARVLRGSSFGGGGAVNLLSSLRNAYIADYRRDNFGFRCVVVVASPP